MKYALLEVRIFNALGLNIMRASFRLLSKKWLWFFLIIGFLATVALVLYVWAITSVGSGMPGLIRDTDMTPQIAWVVIIILAAGVLFAFEWVPADVTALGILVLLVVLGLLPDEEACSGFGSETVLMIFGLFVLTAALLRTGVVDIARRKVLQYSSDNPIWLLSGFFGLAVLLTQPMSNQAAAIVVVPVAIQTALPCPDFLAPFIWRLGRRRVHLTRSREIPKLNLGESLVHFPVRSMYINLDLR